MSWRVLGDWGTSRLRLYRIEDGQVTDRFEGPGIGMLTGPAAEVLRAALAAWCSAASPTSIDLCGMAGSRSGLNEIPYVDCPAGMREWAAAASPLVFDGTRLRIAPGLACGDAAGRPDVMRGEEAQIFGAVALEPDLGKGNVRFVLPGTHSKWVQVDNGRVVGFRTCLSGELFALLCDRSTLISGEVAGDPGDEATGFAEGLERPASGAGLLGSLFETRAMQLRAGRSPDWATGFLSGVVIGSEIAEMSAVDGLPDAVVLIGAAALTTRYEAALNRFGVAARQIDGDACVLRGLELIDVYGR